MAVVEIETGMILFYSGAIIDIPSGFAICDGNNGTPDLRNRFIIGAGDTYNPGDTGGSNTHAHDASGQIDNPYLASGTDIEEGTEVSDTLANDSVTVTVQEANHLPRYYALCCIMKL